MKIIDYRIKEEHQLYLRGVWPTYRVQILKKFLCFKYWANDHIKSNTLEHARLRLKRLRAFYNQTESDKYHYETN